MRFIYFVFTLLVFSLPISAGEYMTQVELEKILSQADSTPEEMGMKQLATCDLYGDSMGRPNRRTQASYIPTTTTWRWLQQQVELYNSSEPDWEWSVKCEYTWQLVSARMIELLGGENQVVRLERSGSVESDPKQHDAISFTLEGERFTLTEQKSLALYHSCKWFTLEGKPNQYKKAGCGV